MPEPGEALIVRVVTLSALLVITPLAFRTNLRVGETYEKRLNEMIQVVEKEEKETPHLGERRRSVVVTGARTRRGPLRRRA